MDFISMFRMPDTLFGHLFTEIINVLVLILLVACVNKVIALIRSKSREKDDDDVFLPYNNKDSFSLERDMGVVDKIRIAHYFSAAMELANIVVAVIYLFGDKLIKHISPLEDPIFIGHILWALFFSLCIIIAEALAHNNAQSDLIIDRFLTCMYRFLRVHEDISAAKESMGFLCSMIIPEVSKEKNVEIMAKAMADQRPDFQVGRDSMKELLDAFIGPAKGASQWFSLSETGKDMFTRLQTYCEAKSWADDPNSKAGVPASFTAKAD